MYLVLTLFVLPHCYSCETRQLSSVTTNSVMNDQARETRGRRGRKEGQLKSVETLVIQHLCFGKSQLRPTLFAPLHN